MKLAAFFRILRSRWRSAARLRIMTYALAASVLCGVTGFLQPVDDAVRNLRYSARDIKADGSIVVVGIDQKSIDALGGRWPWSRDVDTKLIVRLKAAGAKIIVFDRSFADNDQMDSDARFVEILKQHRGDIFLGTGFENIKKGAGIGRLKPHPKYRPFVELADFAMWTNPVGQVSLLPMQTPYGTDIQPSISTVLARTTPIKGVMVRPDYAINLETFPYLSVSDVLHGNYQNIDLRGKDVIIGPVEKSLGDIKYLPRQGAAPGVFVHAIGAQTLKRGFTSDIGWIPPYILVFCSALVILQTNKRIQSALISMVSTVLLLFLPIWLDAHNVSLEIAPAFILLMIVTIQHERLRTGWQKSRQNESSGLSNAFALREQVSIAGSSLVAAKVTNYSAIVASFPSDVEGVIAAEIVDRLSLRDAASEIFQSDDGVFFWTVKMIDIQELGDHLEGLRALFAAPIQIADRRIDVSIVFGADVDSSRPIASRAGSALLSAEEAFRTGARWKIYDSLRGKDAAWSLSIASEIDRAMELGQFWLAFQPKLNLKTNRISGAEVLLRWKHPQRGEISPLEFIPAAEQSQRINALTAYVLRRAIVAAGRLSVQGDYKVAVNVSIPVLGQADFASSLLAMVREGGVKPSQIVLEITESILLAADDQQVESTLAQLRDDGFGLSIDDFGTGFSSLEYVRRIPAHEMKIDQTFVRRCIDSTADRVVVDSVLRMAHELDRRVVAEGVETAEALELLRMLGCDEAQGFYIGRPVEFETFRTQLNTGWKAAA